jgi:hypothetical protein
MAHLTKSDDIKGVEFAGVGRVGGGYMGVGAPSSDGLSLDLQFAADKTLTARRGPTPTFIRSSGDNGGTTYFGPLVDLGDYTEFSTTGITNGRASWFISDGTNNITISYDGTRWRVIDAYDGIEDEYLAAPGSEWRPDQADWSSQVFTITTSSTFGIVKAANNEPRFDHNPTSPFACRGLLIEEGRTNLFSSTNLNDWAAARCTKTPITGIGLTNQATTLTISEPVNTYISRGATLTTSVAYAISVRVKAGTVASFQFADLIDGKYSRGFNLSTNQWVASGGAPEFTNYTVTPNIDGWFLVSAIYTPTGATGVKTIAFLLGNPVVGQTVSFDTPQIEAGSFPTSYIPTTTGTLARSADVCSITGGDFNNFYNQSEGTLFSNLSSESGFLGRAVTAVGSSSAEQVAIGRDVTRVRSGSVDIGSFYVNTTLLGKRAVAYAIDQQAASRLGGVVSSTNAGLPSGMSSLIIGGTIGVTTTVTVSAIRYYRKRLPNAKLQALTA